jgi:hypothetical protein
MLTLVTDNTSLISSTPTSQNPLVRSADTERALADEAAAKAAGFSLRPPVYAIGTAVNATGVRNFRQSRREFEALPFASDACADLAQRVEAGRRCDTLVDAPSLNMLPDGRLTSDFGSLPISERAIEGLARLVTPGGAGYLTECPPSLRATNVRWLARATRCDRNGENTP